MANSNKQSTQDDTKFKKVVQHFLKTPPKPHADVAPAGGNAKSGTKKPKKK